MRTGGRENGVAIGPHVIGPGRRVLIVAEAGVNHDGDAAKAMALVDAGADAGADVVKFQVFRAKELVTSTAPTAPYQQTGCAPTQQAGCAPTSKRAGSGYAAISQQVMLSRLELTMETFARIKQRCAQRGVMFLATPFSTSDVDRLAELGVDALKIASTDLTNIPLLRRAAETRKPMIVSTGASTEAEIRSSVERLREWGTAGRLVVMHCVSSYPTPLNATNLRAIRSLEQLAGVPCGFSDHTQSELTGSWAVAAGACVLEKHLTLDRQAPGPDHAMSLDPAQFAEYVRHARAAQAALGSGMLGMSDIEKPVRAVAGRSVVSAVGISAGSVLQPPMLTIKRPGGGIAPSDLEHLFGLRVLVDVDADTVLTWEMVEKNGDRL